MTPVYNRSDWYWIVGDDESQVYGSANGATVPIGDIYYQAWLLSGCTPSRILNSDELHEVLRNELPKSTIIARLAEIDRFDAVWGVLSAVPLLLAKWNAPDWKNVYTDDPGMLQIFQAAGLTEAEIAQVTVFP